MAVSVISALSKVPGWRCALPSYKPLFRLLKVGALSSYAAVSAMIHEDAGLMKALRRALGIKVRNQFVVGEPCALQLLKAKKRAAENY